MPTPIVPKYQSIIIGESESHPVITLKREVSRASFESATPVPIDSQMMTRLHGLLQAVPSLFVATEASGKQLMEVSINGALTRAADGTGYRAFSMGTNGIKENARLFETNKLQNLINTSAIWQVCSVIVAQKHLADINKKLDVLSNVIQGVTNFLDDQRRARLKSTLQYLNQVVHGLAHGELSIAVRIELESCERELMEIQEHLNSEYMRKLQEAPRDNDIVGTKDVTQGIVKKIEDLKSVSDDMAFCFYTRIATWHVLSLYPGEPVLKQQRFNKIQEDIDDLRFLSTNLTLSIEANINAIDSVWNAEELLAKRKSKLIGRVGQAAASTSNQILVNKRNLEITALTIAKYDQPIRLIFEVENGKLIQARELRLS